MPGLSRISEADAAQLFVNTIVTETRKDWPAFRKSLKEVDRGHQLRLPPDGQAQLDLFVAVLAMGLLALPSLFSPDQAERLREHSLALCDQFLEARYRVRQDVAEYHRRWQVSLRFLTREGPDGVSYLCEKWGVKMLHWGEGADTTYSTAAPILEMALNAMIVQRAGIWKLIKEQYQVVP